MKLVKVENIIERLPIIAETLRRSGVSVGTSQLVETAKILKSYSVLRKTESLELDEIKFILSGTLALNKVEEKILVNVLESLLYIGMQEENFRRLMNEIDESFRLLKIKPGQRVTKKMLFGNGRNKKERVATYLKLRNIGLIYGKPSNEKVADWQRLLEITRSLAKKGFSSLNEVISSYKNLNDEEIVLGAESSTNFNEFLSEITNKRLVKLGKKAIRNSDKRLLSSIAEELNRRIMKGSMVKDKTVMLILNKAGIATEVHIRKIALKDPKSLADSNISLDEKLKIINSLPEEKAAEAFAKVLKKLKNEDDIDSIVSEVDPSLLWAVRTNPYRGKKAELLSAAIDAAIGLRESLLYAETGNEGRSEMALYLAERSLKKVQKLNGVKIGNLTPNTVRAMATLAKNTVSALEVKGEINDLLEKILIKLPISQGLILLRGLYKKADPLTKKYLIKVAANYLYRFSSREGLRLLPRKELSLAGHGKVHVKYSVLRLARYSEDPLVYIRKLKSRSVSLALDLSGSMLEFSMWALSVAMLFVRNIEKLTLFSHEIKTIKGPFNKSGLAELLLSLEFKGYTDLFNAIVEACDSHSKKVIVVSDIKQTVKSGNPIDAIKNCKKGTRLLIITPPNYDINLAYEFELAGVKILVAYRPQAIAREVLRLLVR